MLALWQLLWSNVLIAAVLAVLATGVAALFRRPALTHGLWLLVLLKLVTPPLVPVTVVVHAPAAVPERQVEQDPAPAAEEEEEEADPGVVAPLELIGLPDGPRPVGNPARPNPLPPAAEPAPPDEGPAMNPNDLTIPWVPVLVGVWLASSLAWFTLAGLRVRRFQRLLRHARPADPALMRQVKTLAARLGLQQAPPAWLVEGCVSPMVWMLGGRARLLLPAGLIGRLGEEQRATLLLHELAHLRRGDPWVRWLEMGVTGLYWWLPLLWWARRELRQAEEECCDAWVVRALPGSSRAYAQALVETVDFLSGAPPALPALASGVGPVHLLRRRLTMILRGTTSPKLTAFGLAALLATGALMPLMPSWAQSPGDEPPAQRGGGEQKRDDRKRDDRDLKQAERQVQQMERAMQQLRQAQERLHEQMTKHERQMREAMERVKEARTRAQRAAQEERSKEKDADTPKRGGKGVGKGMGFGTPGGAAANKNVEQRLRDLERKLDAVLREVQQLRNELKRGSRSSAGAAFGRPVEPPAPGQRGLPGLPGESGRFGPGGAFAPRPPSVPTPPNPPARPVPPDEPSVPRTPASEPRQGN
jgi:beta-lactamase regulating signal transducer with metallopeptidase domain